MPWIPCSRETPVWHAHCPALQWHACPGYHWPAHSQV